MTWLRWVRDRKHGAMSSRGRPACGWSANNDQLDAKLAKYSTAVSWSQHPVPKAAIADLIANLLHLARGRGLDTDRLLANAAAVMAEEVAEDDEGDMQAVQRQFRTLLPLDSQILNPPLLGRGGLGGVLEVHPAT